MIELQKRFFNIIDDAVALNLELQIQAEESKRYISPVHWMAEYGTVSFDVGRQVGKTTYIQKRMRPCDLVVVHNESMKKEYWRACDCQLDNVKTIDNLKIGQRYPEKHYYNKIYIDEPAHVLMAKGMREDFMIWYGQRCNQIIMLGTP